MTTDTTNVYHLQKRPPENDRILLVDDQSTTRIILHKLLDRTGYKVTAAASGKEAIYHLSKLHFSLMLLDVVMPGMDGFEVLKAVRKNYTMSDLPVIMVTEKDEHTNIINALSMGANDYIEKSVDYTVLKARIENHLSRKQSEDALRAAHNELEKRVEERTATLLEANKQLSYLASHDDLTGLVNRREFERRLDRILDTVRDQRTEHALCYIDLDQFKIVNDTCGHIAGDELLRQLSKVLKDRIRKRDTLARLGGDEFGVLMEHCSIDHAYRAVTSLQHAIQEFQFAWEGQSFNLGVSMGLVPITAEIPNFIEVLKQADAACFMAKEKGRNRIHVYHTEDSDIAERQGEMQWVTRLYQALEQDRFQLYAQPIVPLRPGSTEQAHYELLVRMVDENGNIIPPGAFLPAAERYNLISKIDCRVVELALMQLDKYPDFLRKTGFCSINLSGQSLADPEMLGFIMDQFRSKGIDPHHICFEITETTAIANLMNATEFISNLSELGCRFALDDFGSGLSSFAYLKNLKVNYLKIDGMFVKDMINDPLDNAIVKSINEIGRVMGMQTIAEFVENDQILNILRELGVDYAQGYTIGKPEPLTGLFDSNR